MRVSPHHSLSSCLQPEHVSYSNTSSGARLTSTSNGLPQAERRREGGGGMWVRSEEGVGGGGGEKEKEE